MQGLLRGQTIALRLVEWQLVDAALQRPGIGHPCFLRHSRTEPGMVETARVWSADENAQPDGDCLLFFLSGVFPAGRGAGGGGLAG